MKKSNKLILTAIFITLVTVTASNEMVADGRVMTGTSESVPHTDLSLNFIEDIEVTSNKSTGNILGKRPLLKRERGLLNERIYDENDKSPRENVRDGLRPANNLVIPSEKRVLKNSLPGRSSAGSPFSTADRRSLSPFSSLFSKPTIGPTNLRAISLPPINNLMVHGGNEEYDQWFAGILYDGGNLAFEYVDDGGENDLIGRFMPVSNSNVNSLLYDKRILVDSEAPEFLAFLEQLQGYSEYPEDYDFGINQKSEACKVIVVRCLGNASTIDAKKGEFDKISVAPQRVLMGPKNLFYYPGMLKLSAFFEHLFDKSRSTDFFNQFVTTFYAGVYGPRRKDLYDIVRVQDIPDSLIDDGLIRISVGLDVSEEMTAEEAFKEVNKRRQDFINADREVLVDKFGKDRLHYKELSPVPKTLEDVLDLTAIILQAHGSPDSMKSKVYEEKNISALQNFYLNRLDPLEVKNLLDVFLTKMLGLMEGAQCNCLKKNVKETGAAFLYAAYILTPEIAGMIENFGKLLEEVKIDDIVKMVDIVHESSIKVSEIKSKSIN